MSELKDLEQYAIERLRACQGSGDTEEQHYNADKVLCDLLSKLGFQSVVAEWEAVDKWYA